MWYSMVEFLFVGICLRVRLADALGDNTFVTFFMASVLAILALHAGRIFEKISTKCTPHDIVKLLDDELVAVHLVYFLFALPDSALAIQANIERSSILHLLCCGDCQTRMHA